LQTFFRLGTTSFDRRPKWSHNFRFAIISYRLCKKKNQSESGRKQVGSSSVTGALESCISSMVA